MSQIKYPAPGVVRLTGRLSSRFQGNLGYLLDIYEEKSAWMLEPFQHRGQAWVIEPLRDRKSELAWAGEYAGKWLDAASLAAASSKHKLLGEYTCSFAAALVSAQEADGYLGIELPAKRGEASEWDNWNIKYAMTGLLTHYEVFQEQASLEAAARCGEWLLRRYGTVSAADHPFYHSTMEGGVNVSIADQLVRLYRCTRDRRFLEFASSVLSHFSPIVRMRSAPQAPPWHAYNLAAYLCGAVELASVDDNEAELHWLEKVWEDLASRHLYPTGSLGYNELLQTTAPNDTPVEAGQPERHHQETCATVEWLMLNACLYRATGRVRYVHCLEQTIYNALLAAQSEDGMSWMYFTPLRYEKRWFAGQTSCCYWSGPRGIARLPGLAFALDGEGLRVNLYESCEASVPLDGHAVSIKLSTLYPDAGKVTVEIQPEVPLDFAVRLRVPFQAGQTHFQLNGRPIPVEPGGDGYYLVSRRWTAGDQVMMEFSLPTRVQPFLNDQYGILVRGPEVLAVDERDNASLDLDQLVLQKDMVLRNLDPLDGRRRYLAELPVRGKPWQVVFTPYADCGGEGARFRTAFPVSP
jgi:DUF1680 family protein